MSKRTRSIESELYRVAAELLRVAPSDIADDYPRWRRVDHVLREVSKSDERLKELALRLRAVVHRVRELDEAGEGQP